MPETLASSLFGICTRDRSEFSPKLGFSPSRYALLVFFSASSIACGSLCYRLAGEWETVSARYTFRLGLIISARFFLLSSIKISAAVIAMIINLPNAMDSGSDVGGAYLTWATAVFSTVYYEAALMTITATGLSVSGRPWYPYLCQYFSPCKVEGNIYEEDSIMLPRKWVRHQERVLGMRLKQRILGGGSDRVLLLVSACLFIVTELTGLFINLHNLLNALPPDSEQNGVVFSNEEIGQCSIGILDIASEFMSFLSIALLMTCVSDVGISANPNVPRLSFSWGCRIASNIYLTRQISLVPLLSVLTETDNSRRLSRNRRNFVLQVLGIWLISISLLPLVRRPIETMFFTGDLSLLWFMLLAPPSYGSGSFIVVAVQAVLLAGIAAWLTFRIMKDSLKD